MKKIKFNLKLPPKAKIEFPHKWKKNALNVRNLKIKNYSNLKLTLPSGWTGVIDIPLAVHSMKGTGKVNTYLKGTMTTQKLNSFLESNDKNLITSYNIIESHTPIEIIYFLNPKLFDIQMTNIITLYGNNVNKIDISTTIK